MLAPSQSQSANYNPCRVHANYRKRLHPAPTKTKNQRNGKKHIYHRRLESEYTGRGE